MAGSGGSHVKLRRLDGQGRIVVPVHGSKPLPPGTLKRILNKAGLTERDLEELR